MDHLPLPRNQAHGYLEVPYLSKEPYDDGPLLIYPMRQRWLEDLECRKLWDPDDSFRLYGRPEQIPTIRRRIEQATAFLQCWLYFGLLKAILGVHVREEDFIRKEEDGQPLITTEKLMDYADAFAENLAGLSTSALRKRAKKIDLCLSKARAVFGFICASCSITPSILLSIGTLGEFLTQLRVVYFPNDFSPIDERWPPGCWEHPMTLSSPIRNCLVSRILADGWCITDVKKLHRYPPSVLYFASNIVGPRGGLSHTSCTDEQCVLLQAQNDKSYVVRHTVAGCTCAAFEADVGMLCSILDQGSIPLILPSRTSTDFKIIAGKLDTKFVAIPHIWSDGIGNPLRNSIPKCQLRRVARCVSDSYGTNQNPIAFWIDTICCPTKPLAARNQALKSMRDVYLAADKVCVLDSDLSQRRLADLSNPETIVLAFLSAWRRRLWTLQEGALARQLLFEFADGLLDFDKSYREMMQNPKQGLAGVNFRALKTQIRGMPDRKEVTSPFQTIKHLLPALTGRSTSKSVDEPLCLSMLLGLNIADIVDAPVAEKMTKFWLLLKNIPPELIFFHGDRLPGFDYQWAPTSVLQMEYIGDDSRANSGTVTESGLLLRLPGMTLPTLAPISELAWLKDQHRRTWCWLATELEDNHDYLSRDLSEIDPSHHLSYALLLRSTLDHVEPSPTQHGRPCDALLVSVRRVDGATIYAKALRMGVLTCEPGSGPFEGQTSWNTFQRKVRKLSERYSSHWKRVKAHSRGEELGVSESDVLLNGKQWLIEAKTIGSRQQWCLI